MEILAKSLPINNVNQHLPDDLGQFAIGIEVAGGNVDKSQSGFDKSQPQVNKSRYKGLTRADTGLTKASP